MPVSVQVDDRQVRIGLGELRSAVTDIKPLLTTIGTRMFASIQKTFAEEGSPAGSWPRLALSTLRNKKYTAGHKLLVGIGTNSGRLRGSITYQAVGNTLVIGTNLAYAAVHQFGSRDYRGSFTGPFTREQHQAYEAERMNVKAHNAEREQRPKYGRELRTGKDGVTRNVRVRLNKGGMTKFVVGAHQRHQNIPPRPYLVFRPEDPQVIRETVETYIRGRMAASGGAQ